MTIESGICVQAKLHRSKSDRCGCGVNISWSPNVPYTQSGNTYLQYLPFGGLHLMSGSTVGKAPCKRLQNIARCLQSVHSHHHIAFDDNIKGSSSTFVPLAWSTFFASPVSLTTFFIDFFYFIMTPKVVARIGFWGEIIPNSYFTDFSHGKMPCMFWHEPKKVCPTYTNFH